MFLFACFTLRQLSNLGNHVVSKALAGLLVSQSGMLDLLQGSIELPSGKYLLSSVRIHAVSVASTLHGMKESAKTSIAMDSYLNYNVSIMQTLDTKFLSTVPELVNYNGNGKKSFDVTLPPLKLKMKGFGLLGHEVNYHAFHSVVGLIRFLSQKHNSDKAYFEHFIEVAQHCGTAYIFNQIPPDQVGLANTILKRVGVS